MACWLMLFASQVILSLQMIILLLKKEEKKRRRSQARMTASILKQDTNI